MECSESHKLIQSTVNAGPVARLPLDLGDQVPVEAVRTVIGPKRGPCFSPWRVAADQSSWLSTSPVAGQAYLSLKRGARGWIVILSVVTLAGACALIPGESAEEFFTRCMASTGFEVSEVAIHDGALSFRPTRRGGAEYDEAVQGCQAEMGRRYRDLTTAP